MADIQKEAVIELAGRIDSNNAVQVEKGIQEQLEGKDEYRVVLDAKDLNYISSAGLRVVLHLRKTHPELSVVNVNSDVYEIFEMTGFTEMMKIEKAYRVVSIEGCEEIGRGANGTIYRIDQDNVVKVYNNADALEDIRHEREVAKLALILGIPTAISYDVVKVGDSYGSVFELLNARSFSKILATEPEKMDWCAKEYADLMKKIHSTVVPEGKLPDMKEIALGWARFVQPYLPEEAGGKLVSLVEAIPADNHMIHGDYHTKNLELQNDEVLLIDMDTLAVGNPIFELASVYNALGGFAELDHNIILNFQGFDYDTAKTFLHKSISLYLNTRSERKIREVTNKARILGYTRMIRRSIRRGGLEKEQTRKEIEYWKEQLISLLEKTNTLLFSLNELEVETDPKYLPEIQGFLDERLTAAGCPVNARMQLDVAVEEIFINISRYAYFPQTGNVTMRVEIEEDPVSVIITFMDHGVPFDPVAAISSDRPLTAEERENKGFGIFITKRIMDDIAYEYIDGKNILTLKKELEEKQQEENA